MAGEVLSGQRQALRELVLDGTLSTDQAAAVQARLEALAAGEGPAARRGWLVEAGGYLGGALTFAGAALLVGLSWDELSRPGRVAVLAVVTALLVAAGVVACGGPRALRAMASTPGTPGTPGTVRRRMASVLFALATGTAALAVGVGVASHQSSVGGAAGLLLAAVFYLLLPSLQVLLAAAVLSAVTATALAYDVLDGTPLPTGLSLVVVGAGWAALALSGVLAHRSAALLTGATIGLIGAQMPLGSSATTQWAYLLTLLVAVGCLAAYAVDRGVLLLAIGVIGVTLVFSEAVADWTNGAASGAAAVLTAGVVLLVGSGLALRVHRHRNT